MVGEERRKGTDAKSHRNVQRANENAHETAAVSCYEEKDVQEGG